MDKKKKQIVVFRTEENESLCHACALVVFKGGRQIPLGEKVTVRKKCGICGHIIK